MANSLIKQGSITSWHGMSGPAMRKVVVWVSAAILWLAVDSGGQMHRYPIPPKSADSEQSQPRPKSQTAKTPSRNPVELERMGRELAGLASTIPDDVQQFNKGLLPKEMTEKLKRIEKLAKQMRSEVGH